MHPRIQAMVQPQGWNTDFSFDFASFSTHLVDRKASRGNQSQVHLFVHQHTSLLSPLHLLVLRFLIRHQSLHLLHHLWTHRLQERPNQLHWVLRSLLHQQEALTGTQWSVFDRRGVCESQTTTNHRDFHPLYRWCLISRPVLLRGYPLSQIRSQIAYLPPLFTSLRPFPQLGTSRGIWKKQACLQLQSSRSMKERAGRFLLGRPTGCQFKRWLRLGRSQGQLSEAEVASRSSQESPAIAWAI